MKQLLLTGFVGLFVLTAAPATGQTVAITNAKIHTVSGDVLSRGTIVLQDGKIAAVGTNVAVPSGARVIDGTGKVVTPGLIESASQLGLTEIGSTASTRDGATSEKDLGASFNPVWAVNPENTHIPITRLRGVTSTVVRPGGSQLFTGQGSVVALDGETVADMLRRESVAIYAAMGETGAAQAGGSRAANYQRLHDALWDARAKMLKPEDAKEEETDKKDSKKKSEAKATPKDPKMEGGRSDLNKRNLEALQAVVSGKIPLVVSVNRVSDLRLAIQLKDEFKIRIVVDGGAEAWRIADELAAADIPVIVSATTNLPTFDALNASLENAGKLQAAGVEVLLTGERALTHQAGLAVGNGMNHEAAIRAVTLGPATVWGVSETMGSLEVGKVADVVVWSGDPLELSTMADHIFIGGREIPEDSRQERLFDRYRDLGSYRNAGR